MMHNQPKKIRFVLRIAHGKSNAPGFTTESDWVKTTNDENNSVEAGSSVVDDDSVSNNDQEESECLSSNDDEGTSWRTIFLLMSLSTQSALYVIGEELYNSPKNDNKGVFDSDEESNDDVSGIGDGNMRAENDNESSKDEDEEDVDETDVLKLTKVEPLPCSS